MSSGNGLGGIEVVVGPREGSNRLAMVLNDQQEVHRDRVNADSDRDRRRWVNAVAQQLGSQPEALEHLTSQLVERSDESDQRTSAAPSRSRQQRSQADELVLLAEGMEFFHDSAGIAYASFDESGHRETWPLRTKGFKQQLAHRFYSQRGKVPGSQAMQDGIAVLEGKAVFDGPEYEVFIRVAECGDDIYVDLCDPLWRAVKITSERWQLVTNAPVKFRRTQGMLTLPAPEGGGTLADLQRFVNVDQADLPLLYAWLINAAKYRGPFSVLVLVGEQGTAKSTLTRSLRALLDPNKVPLRSEPREPRDLAIGANNCWVLAFDNLSYVRSWLSDSLCRMATGGGYSVRRLYTDDEEALFDSQRPVILNSIEDLATRSDLLDRSIILNLEQIPETRRRTEADYWFEFDRVRPQILGALYDAVSLAIRNLPRVQLERLPRMADFAKWAVAAEPAMGVPAGAFSERYAGNQSSINEIALEATPIASAVATFISRQPVHHWRGTATELLALLSTSVGDAVTRQWSWPKSPRGLSSIVRRIAPNLRRNNISVDFHHSGERIIEIRMVADVCVQSVQCDPGTSPSDSPTPVLSADIEFSPEFEGGRTSDATDASRMIGSPTFD